MSKRATPHLCKVALAVAALFADLGAGDTAPVDFRLIPAGEFRPADGRKLDCGAWVCTDEDGRRLVAEASARISPKVIDYEHATLRAKETGSKAPAAGWYSALEWRPGDGLWVIGADWTALAAQEIVDKHYRYISPVFTFDPKTGRVQKLLHASLTNDPGLDGLTDLAFLTAQLFTDPPEDTPVNEELLEQLRWLLNLPVGTTAEEVATHLSKIVAQLKADPAVAANSAGFELGTHLAALSAQVATPDPARFVPVAALSALQGEHAELQGRLAALQAEVDGRQLEALVAQGLTTGKITPATEAWARDLGKQNLASLSAYLDAATAIVKPGETQTGGKSAGGGVDMNDATALAELASQYQADQAAKGISISTVQAVAHVTKTKGA